MPTAPLKLCSRCHKPKGKGCSCVVKKVENRPSAAKRGYGWKWRNPEGTGAADHHLRHNPLCMECKRLGLTVVATDVDHIVPHRGDMKLFWKRDNWQSLCGMHHKQKM